MAALGVLFQILISNTMNDQKQSERLSKAILATVAVIDRCNARKELVTILGNGAREARIERFAASKAVASASAKGAGLTEALEEWEAAHNAAKALSRSYDLERLGMLNRSRPFPTIGNGFLTS